MLGAIVMLCLALGSAPSAAASSGQPVRENCPPGFVWVRMSGTGCVQETLPEHGKTGYDGRPLCVEPYIGIYEQRATTDGQPAPGSPYTSFAFLRKCVTADQYDRAVEELANRDGGPSNLRTGAAGLAVVAGLVVLGGAAVLVNRRRTPSADDKAANERRRQREAILNARSSELTQRQQELDALANRIRTYVNDDRFGLGDLNEIIGFVTSLVGLRDAWSVPAGIASLIATSGGQAQGVWSTDQIRDQMRDLLESVELMSGGVEAEIAAINRSLQELAGEVDPERLAAESYTDYDVVQERIDGVNTEISQLTDQRNQHELAQAEMRIELGETEHQIRQLHDQLFELEYGEIDHQAISRGGAALSVMAGLVALGPVGPVVALGAGIAGAVGSTAGFIEWWRSASVEDQKKAIALSVQGHQHARGRLIYQIEDAANQQAAADAKLTGAEAYKARLRQQQVKIGKATGRSVLWPGQ